MKKEIAKASQPGPLNYLKQSPVRGQLEPYDPRVNKGWPGRFLQCTETPNQLKVLLPPRTAGLYEELLKAETAELNRQPQPSWERLLEIRHLKERMIRKCQKSCKAAPVKRLGRGESFAFQTFIAPSDFRLKEMEKWLKQHEGRDGYPSVNLSSFAGRSITRDAAKRNSYCCHRCSKPNCIEDHKAGTSAGNSPAPAGTPLLRPSSPGGSGDDDSDVEDDPAHTSRYANGVSPSPPLQIPEPITQPVPSLPRTSVTSPEPIPVPYRPRSLVDASGEIIMPPIDNNDMYYDGAAPEEPVQTPEPVQMSLPAIPEEGGSPSNKYIPPPLRTRRSCLKRAPSVDNLKTVSWADDRDLTNQLTKYTNAVKEAEDSGRQWQDMYTEQMNALDSLHNHVIEGLERIRLEAEYLRGVEETIATQRRALEVRHTEFQGKVQNAFQEADHTLVVCRAKREPQPNI
ncbi:hypothetical protein PTI98_001252 [Pleurotus ostreatus]|uniref:Uncharacterized protein n=1 Tax=Pleurotus ostreatus (strain PC15) TaxID=1137138 RepID=A0A067P4Q7_PLEO1|nr:hypothetical protein PTI98_001252 [Pleurotus ostreatus]KDQ30836.1 hypothetical protein PLEOSDRAFT_175704 [Pleurotus ostreatus PC15]